MELGHIAWLPIPKSWHFLDYAAAAEYLVGKYAGRPAASQAAGGELQVEEAEPGMAALRLQRPWRYGHHQPEPRCGRFAPHSVPRVFRLYGLAVCAPAWGEA